MTRHTRISPRELILASLLGLALVTPVLYFQATAAHDTARPTRAGASGRLPGIVLPDPPPGVQRVLPPNAIPAIHDPRFVTVTAARVPDDAPMIVFTRGEETHAYSLRLLNGHEIVNDTVGGEPVAVTW